MLDMGMASQASCGVAGTSSLIPTMSGNTSPSGSVTSSGVYSSSYSPWQALDATTATLWLSNMYASSVWLAYEWGGGVAKTATSYQITYANGSCCEQRGPKNWTLQGWNGASWTTVDTVTNQTGWYGNPIRTFEVDHPGSFTKYRLHVTADNYNDPGHPITLVSIASLQLQGRDVVSQVPTMSGDTSPSGLVTSSGVYSSSYPPWQVFDATTATLWLSNMYATAVWLAYEWGGGAAKPVTSYQITYANGSCCAQRGPRNWTLQGWNGSSWITVDTETNQTGWYGDPIRTFEVDRPGCYTKYRLHVTADNYNDPTYPITLVSIASLRLQGPEAP
ncbi:hypothetical protein [Chondromyces crocatus]|nr:hypothetical protein [Chondromyces crocatus]